jgi:hypothetical protein
MGIVGNLRTMQLEELLQWLSQSKKTGTLEISSGQVGKKIYFKDGRILSSSSTKPEEYLGHFLVSHGLITELELTKAIELQERTKTLLGKILVTTGVLGEDELHHMLRLKAEESIYDIFSWTEADFRFLDDVLPESAMVPMALDVTVIVMEGVQRVDEWRRIRDHIPTQDVVPITLMTPDYTTLSAAERRIIEHVDDHRTVEDIRLLTHSSEFHVCKVLFDQHRLGLIKFVKPHESAAPTMPILIPGSPVPVNLLLEAAQGFLAKPDYDQALRHLRAARCLEPDNPMVQETLNQGEKKVREELEKAGVNLLVVPKMTVSLQDLTLARLSPQEGFLLTRINGTYDIQSILKITPNLTQIDALMVFWKLSKAGYVQMTQPVKK